ncbi:MAG: hypothetical protein LBJ67_09255 [Planctomycetaceae bacterium]|jgi:hypothetical protein|nr:hypothetical protein [Planctomycetaceae bacterium]
MKSQNRDDVSYTQKSFINSHWGKWIFILSGSVMTGMFPTSANVFYLLLGELCSFIVLCVMVYKFRFLNIVFSKPNIFFFLLSAIFVLFAAHTFSVFLFRRFSEVLTRINVPQHAAFLLPYSSWFIIAAATVALPAIFVFMYGFLSRFIPACREWIKNLNLVERFFLGIGCLSSLIFVAVLFNMTNCFYVPLDSQGNIIKYDVVYTSDSGAICYDNAYMNIIHEENDFRQPLFGVFALPFATCAKVLSKILFWFPHSDMFFLDAVQILLLLSGFILISRILGLSGISQAFFLTLSVMVYSFGLFALMMEQYIFAQFWLVLFLYTAVRKKNNDDCYCLIAAAGSLMTSGILFFLLSYGKDIYTKVKKIFAAGIKFFAAICLFGELPRILNIVHTSNDLLSFAGTKLTPFEKTLQFFNFISGYFVKPATVIVEQHHRDSFDKPIIESASYFSYFLAPATTFNFLGILLLAIAVLGFVLNYKTVFAKICMFWIFYSFLILCVVGWGTHENGLILYSLYFGWAYFSLIFMAIEKFFQKQQTIRYVIYSVLIVVLAVVNFSGIYDLMNFGTQYYPVK